MRSAKGFFEVWCFKNIQIYFLDVFTKSSSSAPLIGDQLLSSTSSGMGSRKSGRSGSVSGLNRSRHCSANSTKSCVSFDSAIGDVYSVQTPKTGNPGSSFDMDRDLFDLSGNNTATSTASVSSSENFSPMLNKNRGAKASAGVQFDNLAASGIYWLYATKKTIVLFCAFIA